MNKIKIVGLLIFILSICLAVISYEISNQNRINNDFLDIINEQKAFTQEISKNIFYIYKNKNTSTKQLDDSIKKFITNINNKDRILNNIPSTLIQQQANKITLLWNHFYLSVQKFRDQSKIISPYSNIILEETVTDVYNTNLILIININKLIKLHQEYFNDTLNTDEKLQYTLLFLLLALLIYIFTQLKLVITFVQKFLNTSKNIIKNSTIKGLKPIEVPNNSSEIIQAIKNFNFLADKINKSIEYSSNSIQNSYQSLDLVEKNIEDLLELLSIMEDDKVIDKDLTKKEDAIIQSLEELTSSALNLKNLKIDLDNLISHYNNNNS